MEATLNTIVQLSRTELEQLKQKIDERLDELITVEKKSTLEAEVEKHGYAFRKEEIECKYPHIDLRIGLDVSTWDKEDHNSEDWHVDEGLANEQDPWFGHLAFPDESMRFDVDDVEYVNKEWRYGDWDDPEHNTGWAAVYLYFQRRPLPPQGEIVHILRNEDGKKRKVRSLIVAGAFVYIDGELVSNVAEWKEDVMFL
jgi:hypothetical protein